MPEKLLDPKNWISPKTRKRYMYYDRDGNGYDDVLDWARDMEPDKTEDGLKKYIKRKIVKQETTWLGFYVSTVWIGLDMNHMGMGAPLIFESMVFARGVRGEDWDQVRYTTESQAMIGHAELVREWSNPLFVLGKMIDRYTWRLQWKTQRWWKKVKSFSIKTYNLIQSTNPFITERQKKGKK